MESRHLQKGKLDLIFSYIHRCKNGVTHLVLIADLIKLNLLFIKISISYSATSNDDYNY